MASKRNLRRKSCQSKRRYATREQAEVEAKHASWRAKAYLHVYLCGFCGGYHAGHPPAWVRRGIQKSYEKDA